MEETAGQQLTTVLDARESFAKYHMGIETGETKLLSEYRGTKHWIQ